jgi:hypothetical protein
VVLQPVIQSGTAIYGKSFSGGALNGTQKLLRTHKCPLRPAKKCFEKLRLSFGF